MGEIRFYEGAGCTQHYIGKLNSEFDHHWDLALVSSPVPEGEARSCTLIQVQPGAKVRLYDSTYSTPDANYAEIRALTFVENRCVPDFTRAFSDGEIELKVKLGQDTLGPITRIEMQSS